MDLRRYKWKIGLKIDNFVLDLHFAHILVLGPLNCAKTAKYGQTGGQNTKSSILKQMMRLKYYNFINGLSE